MVQITSKRKTSVFQNKVQEFLPESFIAFYAKEFKSLYFTVNARLKKPILLSQLNPFKLTKVKL